MYSVRVLCQGCPEHIGGIVRENGDRILDPAAVDDAFTAFRWAHANAGRLGAFPDKVAVAGDSARRQDTPAVYALNGTQGAHGLVAESIGGGGGNGAVNVSAGVSYAAKDGPNPVPGDDRAADSDEITKAIDEYGGFTYAR